MSARFLVILAIALLARGAAADDGSDAAVKKYREALKDASPGELYVLMGEELWRAPRGPKKVSREHCDFGLGPGVLTGADAQFRRYFPDTGKADGIEPGTAACVTRLQGVRADRLPRDGFGA